MSEEVRRMASRVVHAINDLVLSSESWTEKKDAVEDMNECMNGGDGGNLEEFLAWWDR